MIGYVINDHLRAELGDDGATVTVTIDGEPIPVLSRHYTFAIADAYAGPADGFPGRVRLAALGEAVGGVATWTGPDEESDPTRIY